MKMYVALCGTLAALTWAGVAAAPVDAGSTFAVSDPVGDAAQIAGPGTTPAYLDIVAASVVKQGGRFEFSVMLAAPLPDRPVLPPQVKELWWIGFLDTDPTTFPIGFPRAPGLAVAPEFAFAVNWNGSAYTASLIDRRPTLTGGEHVITPIDFQLRGAKVTTFLDAVMIGDPASFGWGENTRAWKGDPGTEGFINTDEVDYPTHFIPWPL